MLLLHGFNIVAKSSEMMFPTLQYTVQCGLKMAYYFLRFFGFLAI